MDVHKETFSLCCYTNEKEQAEYPQKVAAHYSKVLNYLEAMRFHYGDDVLFIRESRLFPTKEAAEASLPKKTTPRSQWP